MAMPERRFDVVPRTLRWQGKVWTVLRLQEDQNLFVLQPARRLPLRSRAVS